MGRRAAPIVIMITVLLVQLVFFAGTYHGTEIKSFLFVAGAFLLLAVVGAQVLFGRERLSPLSRGKLQKHVLLGLSAYLVLAGASILWAPYRLAAIFRTCEVLLYVTWALLVVIALKDRRDVSRLIGVFLAAGLLVSTIAFVCRAVYPSHAEQFFLPMGNPNWLAAGLLIPMMLCVEEFQRSVLSGRRGLRPAVGFALAFLVMASVVWFAGSESAAAAFVLALLVLPVLLRARRRWLMAGIIASVIVVVCAADLALGPRGKIRSFAHSKSVRIRLDIWRWSLQLVRRNPVSGLGAGGFFPNVGEVAARDFDANPGYYADMEVHAHNEPLEITVELGLLGLAAFLWPMGALLRGVSHLPRDDPDALRARVGAFAAGWIAVFLQSSLDVGMRFESLPVVFWTGLGLLAASLRLLATKEPATPAGLRNGDSLPEPLRRLSPFLKVKGAAVWLALLVVVLAAGAWFIIVDGMRASIAMKEAIDEKDPAARLRLLRTAAANEVFFVDRVRAHNELGRQLAHARKPRAAGDRFRAVVDMAGDYHDTVLLLASTYLDQNRLDEAMLYLERYGELRPADPRTASLLAAYLRRLSPGEAVEEIRKIAAKYPRSSKVFIAIGKVALQLEPPDEESARRHFEKAWEVNPLDPQAAYLLGMERLKQDKIPDALDLLRRSHRMGFRSPELYVNLARVERMLGGGLRALGLLREGQKLFPDSQEIGKEIEALRNGDSLPTP